MRKKRAQNPFSHPRFICVQPRLNKLADARNYELAGSPALRDRRSVSEILAGDAHRAAPDERLVAEGGCARFNHHYDPLRSTHARADQTPRRVALFELPKHDQAVARRAAGKRAVAL